MMEAETATMRDTQMRCNVSGIACMSRESIRCEREVSVLADWQIALLDQGWWLLPVLGAAALAVFPWRHWSSVLDRWEQR